MESRWSAPTMSFYPARPSAGLRLGSAIWAPTAPATVPSARIAFRRAKARCADPRPGSAIRRRDVPVRASSALRMSSSRRGLFATPPPDRARSTRYARAFRTAVRLSRSRRKGSCAPQRADLAKMPGGVMAAVAAAPRRRSSPQEPCAAPPSTTVTSPRSAQAPALHARLTKDNRLGRLAEITGYAVRGARSVARIQMRRWFAVRFAQPSFANIAAFAQRR